MRPQPVHCKQPRWLGGQQQQQQQQQQQRADTLLHLRTCVVCPACCRRLSATCVCTSTHLPCACWPRQRRHPGAAASPRQERRQTAAAMSGRWVKTRGRQRPRRPPSGRARARAAARRRAERSCRAARSCCWSRASGWPRRALQVGCSVMTLGLQSLSQPSLINQFASSSITLLLLSV